MRYISEDKFVIETQCTKCGKKHSVPKYYAVKKDNIFSISPPYECECGHSADTITIFDEEVKDTFFKVGNEYKVNDSQTGLMIRCPNCGSEEVFVKSNGFGWGKAFVFGVLLFQIFPLGLLAGFFGSSRVKVICKSCNTTWKMSKHIMNI